ncbi:MAG: Gfo/Idh/MocA family oxidoreductase [Clostridia bacterium]|nr:Gfo/Idh/MocA family oxidoreductase [Clostridia bacterium]
MKAVQIGTAGHAFYAYKAIKNYGLDFAALSCGSAGIAAEGTEAALEVVKKRGFAPKLYDNYITMLDEERPDIAIVNPQFTENADVAIAALERGIHVFCEKPLAPDLASLDRLDAACKASKARLAAMFGIRYEAPFVTAKRLVDAGEIGEIRLMDSRKSYKLGKRPAFYSSRKTYCGILPWVAIHGIDWMRWFSGEHYTKVYAAHSSRENGGNGDMDITSFATYEMTNGVLATITADMFRPASAPSHGDDRVRLVGTKGILEITDGALTLLSDAAGGKVNVPLDPPKDIFADFLEELLHGVPCDCGAEASIESTRWALLARDFAERAE